MTEAGLAMRTAGLVRFGAAMAIVSGALRILSAFIPYETGSAGLEALYGVIDLGLMFGVIAIYLANAEVVGLAGLAAFLICLAGIASIVGPDSREFAIDLYGVGALAFVTGLAGLSVQLLRAHAMRLSAWLWIATLALALASPVAPAAYTAAGAVVGAGYVLAGVDLTRGVSGRRARLPA